MTDQEISDFLSKIVDLEIEQARAGDREAAISILNSFYSHLIAHKLPDWRYMDYLADCLEPIINDGADANAALNIKLKPGEKHQQKTDERNQKIAVQVERLRVSGMTEEEAIDAVSRKMWPLLEDKTSVVRKAYKDSRDVARHILDYERNRPTGDR